MLIGVSTFPGEIGIGTSSPNDALFAWRRKTAAA